MKVSLLTIAALVALATADYSIYRKQADGAFLLKQQKILKLYVGLGVDFVSTHDYHHEPFPYNKPEYFEKEEALTNFMKIYNRGLLYKDGVFTLFCHKNRHDTFKIFDLFFYAKDFETFYNIAKWARNELHPLQWGYAFTMAVFHREDTRGTYVPPLYEILPHYFVQNPVMEEAITAKTHGESYGKFEVNNTGWEWSWHRDMLTGPYKSGSKWVGDDVEVRMSYFREDVGLANFFNYFNMRFASWISNNNYKDIHFYRRGEIFYAVYRWIKNRYNLERMANGLTPVLPFETFEKLPGYNSHIQDNFGRNFLVRQDKLIAQSENIEGSWDLNQILTRVVDVADSTMFWKANPDFGVFKKLIGDDINGLDEFAKMIFSTRDSLNHKYYKTPFYTFLQTVDEMVKAPNDREFYNTAMGSLMTMTRDPAFYMVLTSIDRYFEKFMHNFHPYTKEQLNFPGVTLDKFELDRLDTYFEHYDWELTNGIHFADRSERLDKKFEASQFRLNHKPYTYKLYATSDKESDVIVRVFLGPKTDVDGRAYSLDQQRRAMIAFDVFRTKVKAGENIFERHSHQMGYFEDYQKFRPYYEKVNKSIETKEPFYYNEMWQCGAPQNLLLPRGTKAGKEYAIFAIITKYDYSPPTEGYFPCHHNFMFDQHSILFPIDRPIYYDEFFQPNMVFSDVKIYHDFESVFKKKY